MADPALIYSDPADRPGTHVLLVGIGDYPWLEDGSDYDAELHEENAMGMAQLDAPPLSMRKLADWFLDSYDNPERPLASLALILSEAEPVSYGRDGMEGGPRELPRGTVADIEKAAVEWVRRASGRRDNGLVFGFCGHGLQAGNSVLLCRDYGEVPESRFKGAIDFEQFRIALASYQPDTQLFLVDACRTPIDDDERLANATPGNPLLDPQGLRKRDGRPAAQSVQFATSLYSEAWGRNDGPSLFTEALLKALAGGAAESSDSWWVTTGRLHSVLSKYLQRIGAAEQVKQSPATQSQDFRVCKPGPIQVDLYVKSHEPAIWLEPVSFKASNNGFAKQLEHDPPGGEEGVCECKIELMNASQEVDDVTYSVEALFGADSQFANCLKRIVAYPPEVECDLPVSKRS